MPTAELIKAIRREYPLSWWGIHGVAHWARVFENGVRLTAETGARLQVVRLFAVFHDSRRVNEDHDPSHGLRGALLAETLRGTHFKMSDEDFELLRIACVEHTLGKTAGDITVQTCWDADRLDLGRVGIRPRSDKLCTKAAKSGQMISWAYQRSVEGFVPSFVQNEWDS